MFRTVQSGLEDAAQWTAHTRRRPPQEHSNTSKPNVRRRRNRARSTRYYDAEHL
jgi:hypothetical protein